MHGGQNKGSPDDIDKQWFVVKLGSSAELPSLQNRCPVRDSGFAWWSEQGTGVELDEECLLLCQRIHNKNGSIHASYRWIQKHVHRENE